MIKICEHLNRMDRDRSSGTETETFIVSTNIKLQADKNRKDSN